MNEQYFPHLHKSPHRAGVQDTAASLAKVQSICVQTPQALWELDPALHCRLCKLAIGTQALQPHCLVNERLHNTFLVLMTLHLSLSNKLEPACMDGTWSSRAIRLLNGYCIFECTLQSFRSCAQAG